MVLPLQISILFPLLTAALDFYPALLSVRKVLSNICIMCLSNKFYKKYGFIFLISYWLKWMKRTEFTDWVTCAMIIEAYCLQYCLHWKQTSRRIWLKTGNLRNCRFVSVGDIMHCLPPMDCDGVTGAKTSWKMLMSMKQNKIICM